MVHRKTTQLEAAILMVTNRAGNKLLLLCCLLLPESEIPELMRVQAQSRWIHIGNAELSLSPGISRKESLLFPIRRTIASATLK